MKNYQYVLFDWDGCLAKTLEIWLDAYKKTFAEYNVFPEDKEIIKHFGDWEAPKYFGLNVKETFQKIDKKASEALRNVELYADAEALLHKLKPTKKLALLSSGEKITLDVSLKNK